MSFLVEVPADSPYVAGHFPGRPVLPGVAQLTFALDAVARARGAPVSVSELTLARFRRIVEPPDRLEIVVRESASGGTSVDLVRAGHAVASVRWITGAPRPPDDWASAVATRRIAAPPPIESMLPHRPPMLFVDSIVGEAEDGLTCSARVPSACPLVKRDVVPAVVVLEAAAQTAGVWEGLRRGRAGEGGARVGYLVSVRDVTLHEAQVPAEAPLLATARLIAHAGPLAHYRVEVSCETHPVLRGTLGAYLAG